MDHIRYIIILAVLLIIAIAIIKGNKKDFKLEANKLVELLGGKDNIINIEASVSRFKATLKDASLANKEGIQKLGAKGIVEIDNQLKIVFDAVLQSGRSNAEIIKEKWFDAPAMDNSELEWIVAEVLAANPAIVEQFRWWKESVIGFFVGQVMKKTQWKANPQSVNAELIKQLKN